MKISNILALTEADQKLKSLGQQFPDVADAAADVIRMYISNPKKPLSQIINSIVEKKSVNRGNLQKLLKELGFDFGETKE